MGAAPLVIVGAGGHGAEVVAYANDAGLEIAGAFDDAKPAGPWHITRILGSLDALPDFCRSRERVDYITAVGDNAVRRRIVARIDELGLANLFARTVRHASAWGGAAVDIGAGSLLAPNSIVTTRAIIGKHCVVNVNASISHDSIVGDYCNINPGATICGNARLGEGCFVGAGATIIENVTIGAWTVIGAGAVVTDDLPQGVTAVGVPARIIRRQEISSVA